MCASAAPIKVSAAPAVEPPAVIGWILAHLDRTTRAAEPKPELALHSACAPPRQSALLFGVEIDSCTRCGSKLKIIASIEEPLVIAKILSHLQRTAPDQYPAALPLGARAPPARSRLR